MGISSLCSNRKGNLSQSYTLVGELKLVPVKGGRFLYMFNNYTYFLSSKHVLRCSRYVRGKCQALLRVDDEKQVTEVNEEHNHPPPKYHVANDGMYVRI